MSKTLKKTLVIVFAVVVFVTIGILAFNGATSDKSEAKATGETPTLSIVAKNLAYSDSNYLLYAIGSSGFDIEENEVQMLFWTEGQTEYKKGTESYIKTNEGSATVKGQSCLIFYSNGISAKRMVDDIYARAYVEINGVGYYSELLKYSVLEYVYEMRESGNLTTAQENAFTALLDYGAAMQTLLKHNTARLANASFNKITVVNGTLADTTTSGRYLDGEKVIITANEPEEGMEFVNWTDKDGFEVSTTATAEITVNGENRYTANYRYNYTEGLLFSLGANGEEYSVTGYTGSDAEVVIPSKYEGKPVTSIGERAFNNCTFLASVKIPSSVSSIGEFALSCRGLSSIDVADENESFASIDGNLYNKDATALIQYALGKTATNFTIIDSVMVIEKGAFVNCHLTNIYVSGNNTAYKSISGNLYSKDGKTFVQYALGKTATSFTVPVGVTSISGYSFCGCPLLQRVKITNSVTSIGDRAFSDCVSLKSVLADNGVKNIGVEAFVNCEVLSEIALSSALLSIDNRAFFGCDNLIRVYYKGSSVDWARIAIGVDNATLTDATTSFYKELEPELNEEHNAYIGNYWYYDANNSPDLWDEEEASKHGFTSLQFDNVYHWYKCEKCGLATEKERHSGGTATESERAVCDVCGEFYGFLVGETTRVVINLVLERSESGKVIKCTLPEGEPTQIIVNVGETLILPTPIPTDKKEHTFKYWRYVNDSGEEIKLESGTIIEQGSFPDLNFKGETFEITVYAYCVSNWSGYY